MSHFLFPPFYHRQRPSPALKLLFVAMTVLVIETANNVDLNHRFLTVVYLQWQIFLVLYVTFCTICQGTKNL